MLHYIKSWEVEEMEEQTVICPVCGEEILLDYRPEIGEIIYCPQCGASCEVLRNDPLTLRELEENNFLEEGNEEDYF